MRSAGQLNPLGLGRDRGARSLLAAALLITTSIVGLHFLPSRGLRAYRVRSRPELIAGEDKITKRNAVFLQSGLLKMSPVFCKPEELEADTQESRRQFGGAFVAPSPARMPGVRPPSTELLPVVTRELNSEVYEVSIVSRADDLFDPARGIIANPFERGDAFERISWVSARRGDELVVESPVGLRIHGGSSRVGPIKSFSLYFREKHGGVDASPPGLFFGDDTPGVKRLLLIAAYESSQFNNVLATEISARLGCRTSRSVPALLSINGAELPAPYFICEHQSPEFVAQRCQFEEIDWYRLKTEEEPPPTFVEWRRWQRKDRPVTMEIEGERFNLDDLCAWVLAMTFTSTTDNDQGAYFRDRTPPDAPWHCLTWDLDAAFNTGIYTHKGVSVDCTRQPFEMLYGERARMFFQLAGASPEFRQYFRNFARLKLETELPRHALLAIVEHHIVIAESLPNVSEEILVALRNSREFLSGRHERYFPLVDEFLNRAERGEARYLFSGAP